MARHGLLRRARPFGLVALIGVLALPVLADPAVAAAPSGARLTTVADKATVENEIFVLLNADRAAAGLAPLARNPVLDATATAWSLYMDTGHCPALNFPLCHHSRADLLAMSIRSTAPYGFRWWSENVQVTYGGAADSNAGYMGSPAHRANIMRPTTNLVGIEVFLYLAVDVR